MQEEDVVPLVGKSFGVGESEVHLPIVSKEPPLESNLNPSRRTHRCLRLCLVGQLCSTTRIHAIEGLSVYHASRLHSWPRQAQALVFVVKQSARLKVRCPHSIYF